MDVDIAPMKKADKLIEQQRLLQKELEKIQKDCNHIKKIIKFNQNDNRYMWTCIECQKAIGYPTPDEIQRFLQ